MPHGLHPPPIDPIDPRSMDPIRMVLGARSMRRGAVVSYHRSLAAGVLPWGIVIGGEGEGR